MHNISNLSGAELDALLGMEPEPAGEFGIDVNPHIGETARARWEKMSKAQRRRAMNATHGERTERGHAWCHEDTEEL